MPNIDELMTEYQITIAVAKELAVSKQMGLCISTHNPLGEIRDKMTGAKLKRMGTQAGWPDFTIITNTGTYHLEIKKVGGRLSQIQKEVFGLMKEFTGGVFVAYGLTEALQYLDRIGVRYNFERLKPKLVVIDGDKKDDPFKR